MCRPLSTTKSRSVDLARAGIINFQGEREMWASFDAAAAGRRKIARLLLGVGLLVAAALAASSRTRSSVRPPASLATQAVLVDLTLQPGPSAQDDS